MSGWAWSDEDKQEGSERMRAYRICQERGHSDSAIVLTSYPPWNTCRFCGTAYRYERQLVELASPDADAPLGPEDADRIATIRAATGM